MTGTVLDMDNTHVELKSNAQISFTPPATQEIPAGLVFSAVLAPKPQSYLEEVP